jgi:hypothetical protein
MGERLKLPYATLNRRRAQGKVIPKGTAPGPNGRVVYFYDPKDFAEAGRE